MEKEKSYKMPVKFFEALEGLPKETVETMLQVLSNVKTEDMDKYLETQLNKDVPISVGLGKTSTIPELSKHLDVKFGNLVASELGSKAISKRPSEVIKQGVATQGSIFIDELIRASAPMQKNLLSLLEERKVGDTMLTSAADIVKASNSIRKNKATFLDEFKNIPTKTLNTLLQVMEAKSGISPVHPGSTIIPARQPVDDYPVI